MDNVSPVRSLVKKLCRIMTAVDHIEKKGRNTIQNYDFARESDITGALREQFAKENVFMLPDVVSFEYTMGQTAKGNAKRLCVLRVKFTLEDGDSGETRSFHGMGEAEDTSDKASNKAITAAVKYGLLKAFLIPTGDDTENDPKPEKAPPPKPKPVEPPKPTAADVTVLVDSFAALGVTVAELEKRLGWPLGTMSAGDMVGLRKFYAEKRAEKKDPDEAARNAVKAQAEKALTAFGKIVDRIRAAQSEKEATLIQAEASALKLTKGDAAELARVVSDRVFLLKEAAKKPEAARADDVGF